ncbi:lipid-A-disaccharide synthase [Legionella worsleiensis]|uniref:Lipid-A-disaccharide synthase n=1 Tax=Legionella worsleiensis TaxID=45076 RepID=A0A0W1ALD8_9GAMM|nr:lipid-A-disaccharide synthase [Legionella worsleiensis]KTD82064.1 lipid-A-disaccharide synthase [Legionella worsleiensis]STY30235.1 lipid-A-disaccharide synthase [Legionella worsleiensis]
MLNTKHVVIVAGEESGDVHASVLINQLKMAYPGIRISGIGGKHMQKAGAELISDLARYGVTGFTEVFAYFNIIRNAFNAIKHHLKTQKPDLLILVDYPGFNLRLAKYAKKILGLKILYYISPQIWAWKANRIHTIKECIDKMAVILPFEKSIYEQAGVPVCFVGHPLEKKISSTPDAVSCRKALQLPLDSPVFALLPGSRTHEIERHMPVLRDTAKRIHDENPKIHFVIPIAGTVNEENILSFFRELNLPITFVQGKALECMSAADFVIVASGTASLECALLQKPMCIIYKSSFLTYLMAMRLIKVKYLGLCNLLVNKMMISEFLQYDCNAIEISRYISRFHEDSEQPDKMINQLSALKESLSANKSDCSLFELVESELS